MCIFRLTSTGVLAQIETARRKFPQVIPALWFKLYGEPALALPQFDGHDSCPGGFTGSRTVRSLPVSAIPHIQQQLPALSRVFGRGART